MTTKTLRGVCFEAGGRFTVVCLEYYLLRTVASRGEVGEAIRGMIEGHVEVSREIGRDPFEGLPPAPKRYWRMYEEAERQEDEEKKSATPWTWFPARVEFAQV